MSLSSNPRTTIGRAPTYSEQRSGDARVRGFVIVTIAFILLICAVVWLGFSNPELRHENHNNSEQQTDNTKEDNTSVYTAFNLGRARIFSFLHEFRDEINAVSSICIALFTIILAFATLFLYQSTKNLVGDSKKSSELQLRAYVVTGVSYLGIEAGQPLVQVTCANIGQTAALHVLTFSKMDVLPFPSSDKVLPDVTQTIQPEIFLQPRENLDFPVRPITPFDAAAIEQAHTPTTHRLYVFGRIEYDDVFGNRHETPFAYTLSGGKNAKDLFNGIKNPEGPRFELVNSGKSPS
jgi:hypothetical protein